MEQKEYTTDIWRDLASFLGEMIAKYADVIGLDTLPDPHQYVRLQELKESYIRYLKISAKDRKRNNIIDYEWENNYNIRNNG